MFLTKEVKTEKMAGSGGVLKRPRIASWPLNLDMQEM